jgi:hypothetical protein
VSRRFLDPIARIESRIERIPIAGCWIYLGCMGSKTGYGALSVNGREMMAHRASYLAYRGPIPNGLCVLHRCDVRSCVNPEHLFLGTKRDNTQDMMAKGRRAPSPASLRTHCPKGHEYSGKNANGARICKICDSAANLRHRQRNRNV